MSFHDDKAKVLEFFHKLDEERIFESHAQREHIRNQVADATNEEALQDVSAKMGDIIGREISDEEWLLGQSPEPDWKQIRKLMDETKQDFEKHKELFGDREASGTIHLYNRSSESGYSDAKLEGSGRELLLTETHEGTKATVDKYRLSTTLLIELIKKYGTRGERSRSALPLKS